MRKLKAKTLLVGAGFFAILGISVSSIGGNRWESRMTKSTTTGEKSTVNLRSGKKVREDGTQSAATPAPAAVIEAGEGTLHCRDTVLKLNTNFESAASTGVSEVRIAELNHNATRTYNCMDIKPSLVSAAGMPVNGGTLTVKCTNGQLVVTASNCTAPTPTPVPSPTADPNATATPVPNATPPPGYPNNSCSSWCTPNKTCTKSGGKGSGGGQVTYRTCQNGQYFNVNTGKCLGGSAPSNCF